MYLRLAVALTGLAVGTVFQGALRAHESQSHSLESDRYDEREGIEQRDRARHRVVWRDARWRQDPVVRVKLLGINDFHGQLSPRTVAGRSAGRRGCRTRRLS